ncbi:ChbG/HpnK family deacetylase [Alkalibacter mobilis]|uniref:ChbG/HpnK family deacetylase n=1 Tax=Alkalibacter mobilis TaxID=2787712 RepID=UPI0018A03665|nr:ChbG/HpnK family deacetylase [Alkalibacter mobilis]MBF7097329.1 ChbG/HpnK family deacetylase [Alkalibacter mobilis]
MKEVLITADDFGMCQPVDRAIMDLIEIGMITTTNVITNMETLENGKILRREYPWVSVGIHWNVTTGKPISKASEVKTLVGEEGEFYNADDFKKRITKGLISPDHLRTELINQYNLFQTYCGFADYWNVHENAVLCRKAYRIFADVAKELKINKTRNFQRVYLDFDQLHGKRKFREVLVKIYMDVWYGHFIKREFSIPDGRIIAFGSEGKTDLDRLIKSLENSSKQRIELVVHPSTLPYHYLFGDMSEQRVKEYEFFKSKSTAKSFHERFNLVGFDVIDQGGKR